MALIGNIYIDAGSSYSNTITVTQPNGAPLDLTGYTVASQMRKSYNSSTAFNLNATIYSASEGKVKLLLSPQQSEDISPGRWLYDLEITSPSGVRTRVVEGIATVSAQITKI